MAVIDGETFPLPNGALPENDILLRPDDLQKQVFISGACDRGQSDRENQEDE